jgi:EF hand
MRKHVLLLTTTAAVLGCGAIAASAQAPVTQTPPSQQGATTQRIPGGSTMQQRLQDHVQSGEEEDSDQDGRMMRRGYGHHGSYRGHSTVGLRIIFSLMDADGDGTVSLQKFQAAQERIFRARDADHDGTVTFEEMQDFLRGAPIASHCEYRSRSVQAWQSFVAPF